MNEVQSVEKKRTGVSGLKLEQILQRFALNPLLSDAHF